MGTDTMLTLALMVGAVVAFTIFHRLLRHYPQKTVPREPYRWPVWNWYAILVIVGILTGLTANFYWNGRTGPTNFDEEGDGPEIEHIRGVDKKPYGGGGK